MTQPPLKVALLGYGYAGKTFHAPLIHSIPDLRLHGVASSQPAKVQADFPEALVFSDPLQALQHPEIDLVVIATPNTTHFDLARQALQAGKHVVVDKPFTLTVQEAATLTEQATAAGKLLSVFHNRRWDADFLTVQKLLQDGTLGEVVHFESHFDRYRPRVLPRWREQDLPGSGLWYDLGPHLLDQALVLFGWPDTLQADLALQREGAQSTDWCHVVLGYGSRRVILHASMLVCSEGPRFTVHGTLGSWLKWGLDTQESLLKAGKPPGAEGWGEDPRTGTLTLQQTDGTVCLNLPNQTGDYRRYYQGVASSILHGSPNPVTPEQALQVMELLELAEHAHHTGQRLVLKGHPHGSRSRP